jgi:hypothetical protein
MSDTYASVDDLTARLSGTYTVPPDAVTLLAKASELINYVTRGQAQSVWDDVEDSRSVDLGRATCDQVEYWLEVGEEHDVLGLRGSLQGGRVQIQKLPPALGPRARRTLLDAGLLYAGVRSW